MFADRNYPTYQPGQICDNGLATPARHERSERVIALGRKSRLFRWFDRGSQRAAIMYSLIVTAKMNDIDLQSWLADVLARIAEDPVQRIDELLPWNCRTTNRHVDQAA